MAGSDCGGVNRFLLVLALLGNELPETNFLPPFALPCGPGVSNGDTEGSSTRTPHELVVAMALRFQLLGFSLIEQTVCLVRRRDYQDPDFERFSRRFCSKAKRQLVHILQ